MIDNLCLVCDKNSIRIEKKTGYIKLLLDSRKRNFVTLPSTNLNFLEDLLDNVINDFIPKWQGIIKQLYGIGCDKIYSVEETANMNNETIDYINECQHNICRRIWHRLVLKGFRSKLYQTKHSIMSDDVYNYYIDIIKTIFKYEIEQYVEGKTIDSIFIENLISRIKTNDLSKVIIRDIRTGYMNHYFYNDKNIETLSDLLKMDTKELENKCEESYINYDCLVKAVNSYIYLDLVDTDKLNLYEYPLIKELGINEITEYEQREALEKQFDFDSLIEAGFSPKLISFLLSLGYYDILKVIHDSESILELLNKCTHANLFNEFQIFVNKCDNFTLVIDLDIELFAYIFNNKIDTIEKLREKSSEIEEEFIKTKIETILEQIDTHDRKSIQGVRAFSE